MRLDSHRSWRSRKERTSVRRVNEAMKGIESENPDLKDILPKTYTAIANSTLVELLKLMASIPMDIQGDAFGRIYEYFLGKFAMTEGQKGGEFFTPSSIVKLIVEIIEPFHGTVYDPACGSGGMFVQSARFTTEHRERPTDVISVYGQERVAETVRLCKMNLAVHGVGGGHQGREQLLRRLTQLGRQVRLRDGQSALQRESGGQGAAGEGRTLPVRPAQGR